MRKSKSPFGYKAREEERILDLPHIICTSRKWRSGSIIYVLAVPAMETFANSDCLSSQATPELPEADRGTGESSNEKMSSLINFHVTLLGRHSAFRHMQRSRVFEYF
jgi:hypothetical protein